MDGDDISDPIDKSILDKITLKDTNWDVVSFEAIFHDIYEHIMISYTDELDELSIYMNCYIHQDEIPQNIQESINSELLFEEWIFDKFKKKRIKKKIF